MNTSANPEMTEEVEALSLGLSRRKAAVSLMEQAYGRLRSEILSCRLPPGAEISETDIAERLLMSKSPVREALGRLRSEGFVKAYPRRGYQVVPLTISDLNELLDLRNILESGAVSLAAVRITEPELDALDQMAAAGYDKEVLSSLDQFVGANRNFHSAIVRASGNRRLYEQLVNVLDGLERFFYIGARSQDISPQVNDDHVKLVQALRAHDGAGAARMILEHNDSTREGLVKVISQGWGGNGLWVE
jgi:DNA-binding GntR family transcriptional regulator